MDEPPARYNVTITVTREDARLPDPVAFAAAASRAAWRRSASIVTAHTVGQIIIVVTVDAPGRYAAAAVARAVVSEALRHQVPVSCELAGETRCGAAVPRTPAA